MAVDSGGLSGVEDRHHDIFFAAVETTRMPMIVTDPHQPDNPIVFANRAFLKMTGYAGDEVVGRNCRFLQGAGTDAGTIDAIRSAIAGPREVSTEILNYRKDGSSFWNALFVSPVFDRRGRLVYFFASQLDVSRRREAEEGLHQAQKMESLGQLTGGIAHDFNNLLQVISGYTEVMLSLIEQSSIDIARVRRAGEAVRTASDRAAKLTHQLLAFSRKQRLGGRVLSLNSLVANMGEMTGHALGDAVELRTDLAPDLWLARIDPTQTEVALLNVLINARDAMPSGGTVTLATGNVMVEAGHEPLSEGIAPGAYVMVSVTDTGTGMPPGMAARVMEPFFTTKGEGKGTGLGLAMVYGFVEQSGGTVRISSEVGRGTTIRLLFPASDRMAVEDGEPAGGSFTLGGGETILVVDDRRDVAATAEAILSGFGYRVLVVSDPREAMDLLEGNESIDLLFTDLIMPGAMDGAMLARAAQARRPTIKILLTTGSAEASPGGPTIGNPGFDVIDKPYGRVELARRVRHLLDGPTGVGAEASRHQ
ncbi:ATP-binding protein [Methylobacterium sp. E-005]|uniref:histidine kinase famiy protein n=1 Tax=Methylobacterium sp. E-005 TaxID=2836549 RepID=UPI001FB8BC97|nr:histidine kinase famiy protein [Methylobacterium sp. E-005]MCJ2086686.1 ATP-binding protein [Methylobacterium sp. E-005]